MKKHLLILTFALLLIVILVPKNAFAFIGFIDIFTTDSFGSTTPKDIFAPEEIPYLYMSLEIPDGAIASTVGGWNDPDSLGYFSFNSVNADTQRWASLANWDSIKKVGPWVINANYFDSQGNNIVDSTNFTVTPEPATMSLLLIGGIPLLVGQRRRKLLKNKLDT